MNRVSSWLALWLTTALATAALARADDRPAPAPDSTLEIIEYKAPPGWRANPPAGASRVYASPDSNLIHQTFLDVALTPAQANLDFPATFDKILRAMAGSARVIDSPPAAAAKTRQGLDALSQTLVAQSANGQQLYVRMVAARVNDRMAAFALMAPTKELFDRHEPDLDALLQSVSFKGIAPAAAAAAPAAANGAAEMDPRLKQAMARFAKEADGRRKPDSISGDILTLDGKPIPNVAAYELYVGGTTIAGERTHFNLDVDEHGHFEQRLPDGLYKVSASAVVNYAGHRVPVDLVSLDGKPAGTSHDAGKGIVKDFRLVLGGLKPGEAPDGVNAWFGGVVTFRDGSPDIEKNFHVRFPNAKLRITFTPAGPLIDGSTIQPFNVDVGAYQINYNSARLQRIPMGVYRLSATLVTPDGKTKPVAMSRTWGGQYTSPYELFWESVEGVPTLRAEPDVFLRD